ncbi:MAG: TetR family transcriptional regulator [Chloroflexi bacterium]|nr:TetR family transcriptional regulator [Chloroflexota bacterium]
MPTMLRLLLLALVLLVVVAALARSYRYIRHVYTPHLAPSATGFYETATHTFQTLGYARTTTQAIADQADVAEVTTF